MLHDDVDLKGARLKHFPEEITAAKYMYIMMWKLFICSIKTMLQCDRWSSPTVPSTPSIHWHD
eukprot:11969888-Ditylum_brightwellii.AAC.1